MGILSDNHREAARQALARRIDSTAAHCSVIGLGYIGTAFFEALAGAGYSVFGHDRSPAAVTRFQESHRDLLALGRCAVGADPAGLRDSDVVVVAVRLPVGNDGTVTFEPLESALISLSAHPQAERLVIIECTLPVGTTRDMADFLISHQPGSQLFVAHVPERLRAGDREWTIQRIPHLVGGIDQASTALAVRFLSTICDDVIPVSRPEVTELSKLLENAFLTTNIALVGEITAVASHFGLSAAEVVGAAATKPFGYLKFHPGPGVGGHCLPNDLALLRSEVHRAGVEGTLLDGVSTRLLAMPGYVVDRLECLAAEVNATLANSRVLVIGVGFKIGSHDTTESPAIGVITALRLRGATPVYFDSGVSSFAVSGVLVERITAENLQDERFPFGVILSGDRTLESKTLVAAVDCLLDAGGGRILVGALTGTYSL